MAKQDTKQAEERLENVEEALSKTELWIENNQKTLWGILIAVSSAADSNTPPHSFHKNL